jgi:hypothetical protein
VAQFGIKFFWRNKFRPGRIHSAGYKPGIVAPMEFFWRNKFRPTIPFFVGPNFFDRVQTGHRSPKKVRPRTGREAGLGHVGGSAPKVGALGDAWSNCREPESSHQQL